MAKPIETMNGSELSQVLKKRLPGIDNRVIGALNTPSRFDFGVGSEAMEVLNEYQDLFEHDPELSVMFTRAMQILAE